jgi:excisionase family DNA binding protein
MATASNRLVAVEDPTLVLARLRRTEAAMSSELVALRETIVQVEAVLKTPPVESSLLTVVEAARELRVSRSRVFELLAAGELDGVMIGRARCVPRRSLEAYLARLGAA